MLKDQSLLTLSREDWVNHQLTQTFITNSRTALRAAVLALPVVVAMLFGQINTWGLGLWVAAAVYVALHRQWVTSQYQRHYVHAPPAQGEAFIRRHAWSWPASSVVWGSLMFLYLDKAPLASQFTCMMVIVGMGAFAVGLMSARLDCFNGYIDGLGITSLLAIGWRLLALSEPPAEAHIYGLMALALVFWWLLRSSGYHFHRVQRKGFELQQSNAQLIDSLLTQTEAAKQAVQVKNQLLAHAAHDLRQPVHALAFYADWLRNEPELSTEIVPKILQCTDSVHDLFDSLFDFARIEAGTLTTNMKPVLVSEVMNEVKLQFDPVAHSKGLELRMRVQPALIFTDPILLRRIVGNLVANALRYTERGGVLLSARVRHGKLWLEVWDTGIGILPEHRDKVFQEFYKVRQHAGTEEGFGLGLAIVRRLSQALGISVNMRSTPGMGTRMRLEIVLATDQAAVGAL
jgi:signal transduction histidine kinase